VSIIQENLISKSLEVFSRTEKSVEENLALDIQLAQEAGETGRRALRLWWGGIQPVVVLGCGDKPEKELNLEACSRLGVPYVKRVSGGGTVLQTSGVLNYSYTAPDHGLIDIRQKFVLGAKYVEYALLQLGIQSQQRGTSDIAIGDRKISGNAQARKWHSVLLHGTILVEMDYNLAEAVLSHPSREPAYRQKRSHREFMVTLRDLGVKESRLEIEEIFLRAASIFMEDRIKI
jgi:lipoate-protein ligase A